MTTMNVDLFNFDVVTPMVTSTKQKCDGKPKKLALRKWNMFEYLEGLKGNTALMSHQDETFQFQVPIHIDELRFSSGTSMYRPDNNVSLFAIEGNKSSVILRDYRKSGMLSKIECDGFKHSMYYVETVDNVEQELQSKSTFELKDYSFIKTDKQLKFDDGQGLNQLVGMNVRATLRCENDTIRSIETMPFKIISIRLEPNDVIVIEGTNDFYLKTTGFKRVRESSSLIFDICTPNNGYSRSFHLFVD